MTLKRLLRMRGVSYTWDVLIRWFAGLFGGSRDCSDSCSTHKYPSAPSMIQHPDAKRMVNCFSARDNATAPVTFTLDVCYPSDVNKSSWHRKLGTAPSSQVELYNRTGLKECARIQTNKCNGLSDVLRKRHKRFGCPFHGRSNNSPMLLQRSSSLILLLSTERHMNNIEN